MRSTVEAAGKRSPFIGCYITFIVGAFCVPNKADAMDGLMLSGANARSTALAGAGAAAPEDAQIGALNPAGFAFVGNQVEVTASLTHGDFDATLDGQRYRSFPLLPVPLIGGSYQINDRWAVGISTYGSGDALDYHAPIPKMSGVTHASDLLLQAVAAPSVAYKLSPTQAVGVSLLVSGQYFKLTGLQAFGVDDPGAAMSFGAGFSVGYMGRFFNRLQISAAYFSKINMGSLKGYSNVLPGHTDMNVPQRVVVGAAFDVSSRLKLLLDFNWINWRDSIALANGYPGDGILGSPQGPGPGWRSQKFVKAGIEYKTSSKWTVFGGISGSNSLWAAKDNALNYYTLVTPKINTGFGFSFSPSKHQAFSFGWNRAYGRTQTGTDLSAGTKLASNFDTFAITCKHIF